MLLKKLLLVLVVLGLFGCDDEIEIPLKVSKNFWYKYENAKETEWIKLDSTYTVSYSLNNFPKTASFKSNGEWIETISYLPPKRSMVCVRDFVDQNYDGATILEVVFVETAESEKYFVTIESSDGGQVGSKEGVVLEFNSDCDFVGRKT